MHKHIGEKLINSKVGSKEKMQTQQVVESVLCFSCQFRTAINNSGKEENYIYNQEIFGCEWNTAHHNSIFFKTLITAQKYKKISILCPIKGCKAFF